MMIEEVRRVLCRGRVLLLLRGGVRVEGGGWLVGWLVKAAEKPRQEIKTDKSEKNFFGKYLNLDLRAPIAQNKSVHAAPAASKRHTCEKESACMCLRVSIFSWPPFRSLLFAKL